MEWTEIVRIDLAGFEVGVGSRRPLDEENERNDSLFPERWERMLEAGESLKSMKTDFESREELKGSVGEFDSSLLRVR